MDQVRRVLTRRVPQHLAVAALWLRLVHSGLSHGLEQRRTAGGPQRAHREGLGHTAQPLVQRGHAAVAPKRFSQRLLRAGRIQRRSQQGLRQVRHGPAPAHALHPPAHSLNRALDEPRTRGLGQIRAQPLRGGPLGQLPAQRGRRLHRQRMQHHPALQLQPRQRPGSALSHRLTRVPLGQRAVEVLIRDAALLVQLAVARLGQVGLGAKGRARGHQRLVEGQVLEGVQRVVVHEDANGPLHRQQVGRVVQRLAQPLGRVRRGGMLHRCWCDGLLRCPLKK